MEELFLELDIKRSDDITLELRVKTITFAKTNAFRRKNFKFCIKNVILQIYCKKSFIVLENYDSLYFMSLKNFPLLFVFIYTHWL